MSLDLTTYPLRYRRGGTTYSFHGYTSAQGGTRYLAIRRGGVVRYIPFTTNGSYFMRLRWNNTTYNQLLAYSNVVVSYSIERGTGAFWTRNMRIKVNSVSSNYGLTTATSVTVTMKMKNGSTSSSASVTLSANSTSAGGSSWSSYVNIHLLDGGYTASVKVTSNGVTKSTSFDSTSIDNITKSFTATFS